MFLPLTKPSSCCTTFTVSWNVRSVDITKRKCKVRPRTGHENSKKENKYSSTLSLTSALGCGGWSTPRPGCFTPDRVGTQCTEGWVSPRSGLDECGKSRLHWDLIPGLSRQWWVAIPTEPSGSSVTITFKLIYVAMFNSWDRGFESLWGCGCLSLVIAVCCAGTGLCDELIVQRSATGVCVCQIAYDL
jgi:hypothetical protein